MYPFNNPILVFCRDNGIVLYTLLPNATNILQVADVAYFGPIKKEYFKTSREFTQMTGESITLRNIAVVFGKILEGPDHGKHIRNGFKTCGIYPYNPNAVEYKILILSIRIIIFI